VSEPTNEELVAQLASAPDLLDASLAALGATPEPAAADATSGATSGATGEAGWTTSEIIGHLCDAARYWGARMRLAAHEERPALQIFDQDSFVALAAYRYVPANMLAQEFRLINASNVALLRGLSASDWQRVGIHSERGPLTIRQMVEIEAGHELEHARSLADAR
jgi:hypothetical protein